MRKFAILYDGGTEIHDESGLKNFIETAVLHNRDIHNFGVVEIDSRLTEVEANVIASRLGKGDDVVDLMDNGATPYEAFTTIFGI